MSGPVVAAGSATMVASGPSKQPFHHVGYACLSDTICVNLSVSKLNWNWHWSISLEG
jgi:hypothetical protein